MPNLFFHLFTREPSFETCDDFINTVNTILRQNRVSRFCSTFFVFTRKPLVENWCGVNMFTNSYLARLDNWGRLAHK